MLKLQKTNPLRTIVYEIIKDFNFTSHQTIDVIQLLEADTGKYIQSSTHRILKNRKWLIISPILQELNTILLIEEDEKHIEFPLGKLKIDSLSAENLKIETSNETAQIDTADLKYPLLLRRWKSGDYFYPLGMKKKKKINRFLIDQKLSQIEKQNTWVIESNKKIVWVVGKRIDDRFKIEASTKQLLKMTVKTS